MACVCVGRGVEDEPDELVGALLPQAAAMNAIATSKREIRNTSFFMKTSSVVHPEYRIRMYSTLILSSS